jgi:hypothetical protein
MQSTGTLQVFIGFLLYPQVKNCNFTLQCKPIWGCIWRFMRPERLQNYSIFPTSFHCRPCGTLQNVIQPLHSPNSQCFGLRADFLYFGTLPDTCQYFFYIIFKKV